MNLFLRSCDGNVYVYAYLCHASKFVLHVFGVPENVHSDNGKQFVSDIFKSFLSIYGTKQIKTAFYSLQGNAAEGVNRSVLQVLRSFIKEYQRNWDKHISDAAFALGSTIHSAINISPYYAAFGQHAASYDIY